MIIHEANSLNEQRATRGDMGDRRVQGFVRGHLSLLLNLGTVSAGQSLQSSASLIKSIFRKQQKLSQNMVDVHKSMEVPFADQGLWAVRKSTSLSDSA